MRDLMPALLLATTLFAVALPAAEDPANVPGLSEDIPCPGDASFTYDLIIPDGYTEDAAASFPAFFLSSPNGDPSLRAYRGWADEQDFLVVAINNSRNGPWDNNLKAQDLVLAALEERGLRMHHCLNYAGGHSGAASSSVKLVSRLPERFAGVHLSIHSGSGTYAEPHQAVTIYAGLADDVHPWSAVQGAIRVYESAGNPLLVETHPGGHQGADPARMQRHVEWMYYQTFLSHPQLTRADGQAGLTRLEQEVAAIAELASAEARRERSAFLLGIEAIARSPAAEDLLDSWTTAVNEAAAAAATDVDRFWILTEAVQRPWFRHAPRELARELRDQHRELQREPALADELTAYQAFQRVEAMAAEADNDRERQQAAAGYRQISERFPETRYGRRAAQAASE